MPTLHKALILAAGRGARMMPLTAECPKPMIPIAGKPILERVLVGLRAAGIDEAVIVYGYLGNTIRDHFGDGSSLGMRLTYREQHDLCGTAGAMLLTEDLFAGDPFLLHWGDILVDPANYRAEIEKFNSPEKPDVVLSMKWVDDPYAGGAVYLDGEKVARVVEKPAKGTAGTHWVIAGVIAFSPLIWQYLHKCKAPECGEFYVTQAIDLMIQHGYLVRQHEMVGERIHLTSPEGLEELHQDPRVHAWQQAAECCLRTISR